MSAIKGYLLALLVSLCFLWNSSAQAVEQAVSAHLISGNDPLKLALIVDLEPGWHTYWRSPGLAGSPPSLNWLESKNLKQAELLYPIPKRISSMGTDTIGYDNQVIFPIILEPKDRNKAVEPRLSVRILACKEQCVPFEFDLSVSGSNEGLIKSGLESLPYQKPNDSLLIKKVVRKEKAIVINAISSTSLEKADAFVETDKELLFSKPTLVLDDEGLSATLSVALESSLPAGETLETMSLTITVTNGDKAVTQHVGDGTNTTQQSTPSQSGPLPLWCILLLAVLGGFILNLMPCVLPVLSLKIMAVIKHSESELHRIRHSFLSSAAGILVSFLGLALVTIALKEGGQVIGWGVQFQQPTFLVFIIFLLTLFAANLWGFFEINLPRFVLNRLDTTHHPKLAGDFATGMLATLLATPCSAPFLGTAIAFALTAGWIEIIMVFFALGLGMALPYYAIALYPHIAKLFPKPGNWMERLRTILGFGMAGTAAWLLFVLFAQIGRGMTMLISAAMLAILLQLFLRHHNKLRLLTWPVIGGAIMGSFSLALLSTMPPSIAPDSGVWKPFDEKAIEHYVSEGKVVFLDITADWCLTCKANKRFTLSRDEVEKRIFNAPDVIAMQGNWTNPNPLIAAYLQKNGRFGIPFNVVFGPKAPQGIILPELLTPTIVLNALDQANGNTAYCSEEQKARHGC